MKAVYILIKDQITIMKKTNTYMPKLLTKLLQSQCVESQNENNSLDEEKVYERNPSYKIQQCLNQVNSKLWCKIDERLYQVNSKLIAVEGQ